MSVLRIGKLSIFELLSSVVLAWGLNIVSHVRREHREASVRIEDVVLSSNKIWLITLQDLSQRLFINLFELIVFLKVRGRVLIELEEATVVLLSRMVGVSKEVKDVAELLLNVINLGLSVPVSMGVRYSSGFFNFVSLSSPFSFSDQSLEHSLCVGSFKVF